MVETKEKIEKWERLKRGARGIKIRMRRKDGSISEFIESPPPRIRAALMACRNWRYYTRSKTY